MADPNITEVHLLNVPLENDYRHTIWFPDQATQESYFKGKVKRSYTDFSYQRKDGIIRVGADFDSVVSMGCNYVMYRNKAYSNKWFYAFITDLKYVSEGRTDISIETDVMQTWLFNHTVQASYIEREHCFDDSIGANTQPEGLETGEYVINGDPMYTDPDTGLGIGVVHFQKLLTKKNIIIASTVDATGAVQHVQKENELVAKPFPYCTGNTYNGIYSGVRYFKMASDAEANIFLDKLAQTGQVDAVQAIFLLPDAVSVLIGDDVEESYSAGEHIWSVGDGEKPIYKPHAIDGVTVRNNKLYTYPYCYLMMTNNAGVDTTYQYELFKGTDTEKYLCRFKMYATITPGGSVRLVPLYYAGVSENYSKGISGGKFPVCSWACDAYTNWLTQNAMNLSISEQRGQLNVESAELRGGQAFLGGYFGALGNAASGKWGKIPSGVSDAYFGIEQAGIGIENGLLDIKSVAAQKYQHSLTPPEARGNLNSGDVTYAMDMLTFSAYHMSIKAEYARIIDKYFDMYGYATNLVKTPYKNHRESYWFTKTIAANVDAAIPNTDLNIIKRCYNNGITFWRHTKTVGDYTQSNNIVA